MTKTNFVPEAKSNAEWKADMVLRNLVSNRQVRQFKGEYPHDPEEMELLKPLFGFIIVVKAIVNQVLNTFKDKDANS